MRPSPRRLRDAATVFRSLCQNNRGTGALFARRLPTSPPNPPAGFLFLRAGVEPASASGNRDRTTHSGLLRKNVQRHGARSPPVTTLRPSDHSNWRYPPRARGPFESAEQSCLPLGPVRLSIGTDAAVALTHDIPSVPCSRAFVTTGAPPTISCPLPAPLSTSGHHTVSCRFRANSLSLIQVGRHRKRALSEPPATSCAAARLRNRDNHLASRVVNCIRIPRNSSVQIRYVPFRRHAQTWALQPGPLQAAPTRWRTRSSKQVSSGGLYAQSLAMQASRADYVGSIHFAFQAQQGFSKREP